MTTGKIALEKMKRNREPLLVEARRVRALSSRLATQAAVAGGKSASDDLPPDDLTPGEQPPSLEFNAQLSSSGNTLTLTAVKSGMLFFRGVNGWNAFQLINSPTLDTTGSTSGRLHDIYGTWDQTASPPTVALSAVAWTNETTRSAPITVIDGVTFKESDTQYRLIAVCRYNGSTMLVPRYDPNGEVVFGTGDPRNNVSDPHSGVGMSAGGVTFGSYIWQFWAALNGVVGVGFNSLGQLLGGAGAVLIDVLGISINIPNAYTPAASVKFQTGGVTQAQLAVYDDGSINGMTLRVDNSNSTGSSLARESQVFVESYSESGFSSVSELAADSENGDYARLQLKSVGGGQAVISLNFGASNVDTQIKGDLDQSLLYADASLDRIGIGTSTPTAKLNVEGTVIFNDNSADVDVRMEGSGDDNLFFLDAGTDRIGIGTASPSFKLEVSSTDIIIGNFQSTLADSRLRVTSGAAVSTSNKPSIDFAAMTTVQNRVNFHLKASWSVTTDASRTSFVEFATTNAGSAVTPLTITGNITAITNLSVGALDTTGVVLSGTYTPTVTNTTNVSASTANVTGYFRIGNIVHVFGSLTADPTAAGGCEIGVSLPIASNLANTFELAGTAFTSSVNTGVRIVGDAANNRAQFNWDAPDGTNRAHSFHFSYQII